MSYKILVAEDDSELCDVLSLLLEAKGYVVHSAHEGIDVLEQATKLKPDLILLDWNMPFGKGSAVLEMLAEKKLIPALPVIVLSGSTEPGMKELALSLGAQKVLRKPYENDELLAEIAMAIKK